LFFGKGDAIQQRLDEAVVLGKAIFDLLLYHSASFVNDSCVFRNP